MSADKEDIELIHKYLNGQLDARAMHELEYRAQNDPFLADLMKGMEMAAGVDNQENLNEIDRLIAHRVQTNDKKKIPLWRWVVAACLLLLISIVGYWLPYNSNRKEVADNSQTHNQSGNTNIPATTVLRSAGSSVIDTVNLPSAEPPGKSILKKGSSALPVPVSGSVHNTSGNAIENRADNTHSSSPAAYAQSPLVKKESADSSFAKERLAVNDAADGQPDSKAIMGYTSDKRKDALRDTSVVSGQLVNKQLQSWSSVEPNNSLGYNAYNAGDAKPAEQVITKPGSIPGLADRLHTNDALADSNNRLDNIVVAGYSSIRRRAITGNVAGVKVTPVSNALQGRLAGVSVTTGNKSKAESVHGVSAQPKSGWTAYSVYLSDNAWLPSGKAGIVELSFTISTEGTPGNFKLVKSLSDEADKKAIQLIQDGPAWLGNGVGEGPVTLKIKFRKK